MNLASLRHLYSPTRKTQHQRVLVGKNSTRTWVLLFKDDIGDWDRSGPEYLSLAEAFAAVPAAAESYFGSATATP